MSQHRDSLGVMDVLDLTATLGRRLQADLGPVAGASDIFDILLPLARRIADFDSVGLLTLGEDGVGFDLAASDLLDTDLTPEIEHQIAEGTFGWALYRNHAVTVPSTRPDRWILMHGMGTAAGVRGMFVGVLEGDGSSLPEVARELLSVLLFQCASALENSALHEKEREVHEQLEARIRERTEELQASEAKARAASRAKSDFLSHISHEVRAPVNGITGTASLLERTELDDLQREYVDTIRRSADTVIHLVGGVLDLARIEAGRIVLQEEEVDLRALVDDALGVVATKAASRGLDLGLVWEAGAPTEVVGDAGRLRQIITNLLDNAIRYTDAGHVLVRVAHRSPEREVMDELGEAPSGFLVVSVIDTGKGIGEEEIDTVFDKFQRAGSGKAIAGFGLGLAISRELARLMGGEIEVESSLGEGSAFHLSIPSSAVTAVVPIAPNRSTLVVTADPFAREGLTEDLCTLGFEVHAAETLEGAAEEIRSGAPTVAFLDTRLVEDEASDPSPIERAARGAGTHLVWLRQLGAAPRFPSLKPAISLPCRSDRLTATVLETTGAGEAPGRAASNEGVSSLRVLVAEDEPVSQKVVTWMLRELDVRTRLVDTGADAVAAVREDAYDLVLMDAQMPVMGGEDATRAIRELEAAGAVAPCTIVGLTGHALEEDHTRMRKAGMNDVMTKPIVFEDLVSVLRRVAEDVATAAADDVSGIDQLRLSAARELAREWPDRQETLREALLLRDDDRLMREAHRLKGAALVLGADAAAEAAGELEIAMRSDSWDGAPFLLGVLEGAMDDFLAGFAEVAA
jgi:signal transduction histidine kinase/CheY-like chemotaxis protein